MWITEYEEEEHMDQAEVKMEYATDKTKCHNGVYKLSKNMSRVWPTPPIKMKLNLKSAFCSTWL